MKILVSLLSSDYTETLLEYWQSLTNQRKQMICSLKLKIKLLVKRKRVLKMLNLCFIKVWQPKEYRVIKLLNYLQSLLLLFLKF